MAVEQAIEVMEIEAQLSPEGAQALGHLELVHSVELDADYAPEAVIARNAARTQAYEAKLDEIAVRPGMAATAAYLRWAHRNNMAGNGPIAVAKS